MDKKHLFSRLLNKAISMALWTKASLCVKSSLSEQSLPRTLSRLKTSMISASKNLYNLLLKICAICGKNQRNQRLMNYLHAFGIFTTVESALQIRPFMQNEPNFRKSQMNVNKLLTKDYEKKTLGERGKKQSQTNPNKANYKKAKMNVTSYINVDYENISNWAICENEPNLSCRSLWRSRNEPN